MKDVLAERELFPYPSVNENRRNYKILSFEDVMKQLQPDLEALEGSGRNTILKQKKRYSAISPGILFILVLN